MRSAFLQDGRRARSLGAAGAQGALLTAAVFAGAGAAAIGTAAATYFSRYSAFDALYGEIDDDLYLRLTAVAATEKAAAVIGAALLALALVAIVVAFVLERRSRDASR